MFNRLTVMSLWALASVTGFILACWVRAHDWLRPRALAKKSDGIDPQADEGETPSRVRGRLQHHHKRSVHT